MPNVLEWPNNLDDGPNVTCFNFKRLEPSPLDGTWTGKLQSGEVVTTSISPSSRHLTSLSVSNHEPQATFGLMLPEQPSAIAGKFRNFFTFPSNLKGLSQGGVYKFVDDNTVQIASMLPGLAGYPLSVNDPSSNVTQLTLKRVS
jgi:hypothetical protein